MNNQTQENAAPEISGDAADQASEIAMQPGADNVAATEEVIAGGIAAQEAEIPKEDTADSNSATVAASITDTACASTVASTTASEEPPVEIMPNPTKPVEAGSAEHMSRLKKWADYLIKDLEHFGAEISGEWHEIRTKLKKQTA